MSGRLDMITEGYFLIGHIIWKDADKLKIQKQTSKKNKIYELQKK